MNTDLGNPVPVPAEPGGSGRSSGVPVLSIRDLSVAYRTGAGDVRAVDKVTVDLHAGEVVGLVGESGSGKSTLAYGATRLLRAPAVITSGTVHYQGRRVRTPVDVLELSADQLVGMRWREIAIVFQSAMNALNPVLNIHDQLTDVIRAHLPVTRREATDKAAGLLDLVGIPRTRLRSYPHELSGGMRQRVMIAMALAGEPKLLVLDEPTTALDVTTQAQILDIVRDLRSRTGMAILLITHDLGVVADIADRIVVMYAGAKVEEADVYDLFRAPRHPYAAGLLGALPGSAVARREAGQLRLAEIPGMVPVLRAPLESCAFAPRCQRATDQCRVQPPLLTPCGPADDHAVACFHPEPVATVPA